jgi:hypothetical protein
MYKLNTLLFFKFKNIYVNQIPFIIIILTKMAKKMLKKERKV